MGDIYAPKAEYAQDFIWLLAIVSCDCKNHFQDLTKMVLTC